MHGRDVKGEGKRDPGLGKGRLQERSSLWKFNYPLLLSHGRLLSEIAVCPGLDAEEAE